MPDGEHAFTDCASSGMSGRVRKVRNRLATLCILLCSEQRGESPNIVRFENNQAKWLSHLVKRGRWAEAGRAEGLRDGMGRSIRSLANVIKRQR
jgi:hypothetical protein